jgi:hypothetical protein
MLNTWDLPADCNEGELFTYAEALYDRIAAGDSKDKLYAYFSEVRSTTSRWRGPMRSGRLSIARLSSQRARPERPRLFVGKQRRQDQRPQRGAVRPPLPARIDQPQVSLKRLHVPAPCKPSWSLCSQAQRSCRQLLGKFAGCSRTSAHCSLKRRQVPAPCKPSSSLCSHAKRSPLQSCA